MAEPVPPTPRTPASRSVSRGRMLVVHSSHDPHAHEAAGDPSDPAPRPIHPSMAAVGAQLLGEAPRRGLRAGPEVLEQARSTYLQTEYAGPHDRRPRKGLITRTDV